ncbi:MAG: glycosyltransferase family 4 protein [Candidatus Dojkabacteria bacterium]
MKPNSLKIAVLIHPLRYWGGAQYHLRELLNLFPEADLWTAWYNKAFVKQYFGDKNIKTSFLQWLPFKERLHQELIVLHPLAYYSMNLKKYDLVIVVSDGFEKWIRVGKQSKLILNVLTPARFLWLETRTIKNSTKWTYKIYETLFKQPLHAFWKKFDYFFAQKADLIISISSAVAERVKQYWHRDSVVIFPPTPFHQVKFNPDLKSREDWYLYLGGVETYKGVELAIRACAKGGFKLKVVGGGQDLERMKILVNELGVQDKIEFTGRYQDEQKTEALYKCKALILPARDEDFGITYVEGIAAGAPVIAYKGGGALDILSENPRTGVFFDEYSEEGVLNAIKSLSQYSIDPQLLKARAESLFSVEQFQTKMKSTINGLIK